MDVQVSATVSPAVRLYSCHAGPIMSVAASPHSLLFASLAANGVVNIYDLVSGQLLALKEFPVGGTKLLWLPVQVIYLSIIIICFEQWGIFICFCEEVNKLLQPEGKIFRPSNIIHYNITIFSFFKTLPQNF